MGGVCDKGTLRLTDDAEEEAEEEGGEGGANNARKQEAVSAWYVSPRYKTAIFSPRGFQFLCDTNNPALRGCPFFLALVIFPAVTPSIASPLI